MQTPEYTELIVNNIGGIEHTEITIQPGVTTLAGRNATNRTSLLRALNEALGGTQGSVRRGADDEEGHVTLRTPDQTITRTLCQCGETITRSGEPYTTNPSVIDLYVSLFGFNEIRQLIENGDRDEIAAHLGDRLMAPVDTATLRAEIDEFQEQKQEIDSQLQQIDAAKDALPELEKEQQECRTQIDKLNKQIRAKRDSFSQLEGNNEATETIINRLDELETLQEEVEYLSSQIEDKEETIAETTERLDAHHDHLADIENQLEELSVPDADRVKELEEREEQVRQTASHIDSLVEVSQNLSTTDGLADILDNCEHELSKTAIDSLKTGSNVCFLCGNQVSSDILCHRVEELTSTATALHEVADEITTEVEALREQRQPLEDLRQERSECQNTLNKLEHRIEKDEHRLTELEEERDEKQDQIDDLHDQIADMKDDRLQTYNEQATELANLQEKRATVKAKLNQITDQLTEHESLIADEAHLREKKADLTDRITQRRDRVTTKEQRVQETMATYMDALVDQLDYDSIAGAYIDRTPTDNPADVSQFDVVIERCVDGDVIEERDLTTISESERALIGLVVALAGYAAHDVAADVPYLLLDSVEEFDPGRLANLFEYLWTKTEIEHIVAAVLPPGASAITMVHTEISADELT